MNGYKVDFVANTITITAKFAKAMNNPSSIEYKTIAKIRKNFPEMEIIRKTHKTPSEYKTKSGETFNCNQFKNLTCENMENFINGLADSDKYMREYLFIRYRAAKLQTNSYTLIRRWFVAQFPEFRKNPLAYLNEQPAVISASEFIDQTTTETKDAA